VFAGKKHSAWPFGARTRLIVWLLIAGVLWVEFLFFLQYRDGMKRGYTDFAVFYTAGTILRQGLRHQLYDRQVQFQAQESFNGHLAFRRGPLPFIHPPFEAPLFEPLSYLRYPQAFLVWDLLTAVMLFAAAAVLRRSVDALRPISTWKLAVASFAFYPVFTCFMQGQDSILQLLLCAAAFSALRKNHELQAGCWLALAAFKLQFMLPLVMLLFLWRRRRMVWGFAAVGVILLLVSLAVVGEGELLRYPHFAATVVETPSIGGVPLALLPNLHGLATGWPQPFSGSTGIILAIVASVLLFGFAAWAGGSGTIRGDLRLQFSLAVVVSVLIAWQTNAHDLSLLVLPLVLLADYCLQRRTGRLRFALLYPVYPLLLSPVWMWLWLGVAKVNLVAIPMLAWVLVIGRELLRNSKPAPGRGSELLELSSEKAF
jgi:hypothetical protein